jgi:hypothetical protein
MGESDSNEQSSPCADGATGIRYSTADKVGHDSYRSVSRERVGIQTWRRRASVAFQGISCERLAWITHILG